MAASGPARDGRPSQEDDPPEPVSHYGRSKRAGELAAQQWGDRAPITIVRPAIVFGEGDPHCLSIYRSVSLSHIHFVPGRTPKRHSWLHAADLSRLLILAAAGGERLPPPQGDSSAQSGRGYYMADGGQQPTYEEVGRMIGRALGQRRTWVIRFRRPAAWTAAAVNDLFARFSGRPAAVFHRQDARGNRRIVDLLGAEGSRAIGILGGGPLGGPPGANGPLVSPSPLVVTGPLQFA